MDLIATLSLIPDVLPVFGVETTQVGYLTLARAGRAGTVPPVRQSVLSDSSGLSLARAAARTARFARVLTIFEACEKGSIRQEETAKALDWVDASLVAIVCWI